jgi:hypothetical protein
MPIHIVLLLDALAGEPARLRAEATALDGASSRLALANYRVFIANANVVRALRGQSKHFEDATVTLRSDLSSFVDESGAFQVRCFAHLSVDSSAPPVGDALEIGSEVLVIAGGEGDCIKFHPL